jgi:hypothetical protein
LRLSRRVPLCDLDDAPFEDALYVLDNNGGQRAGVAVAPESIEFCLNPGNRDGVLVLPQEFVVEGPGFARLVDRPQEASAAAVPIADDAGLAVYQAERGVGKDTDIDALRAQKCGETLVTRTLALRHLFRRALAPVVEERPGDVDIAHVEAGVADNTDRAVDPVESLSRYLEHRRTEIARDAVIGDGAVKPLVEEPSRQPLQAR